LTIDVKTAATEEEEESGRMEGKNECREGRETIEV